MGESSKFPKSWTLENQNFKLNVCLQNIKNSKFNGQIPLDELKINQKSYYYLLNSAFWGWLSMGSQPQNPEFRNNPENFHPCLTCCVVTPFCTAISLTEPWANPVCIICVSIPDTGKFIISKTAVPGVPSSLSVVEPGAHFTLTSCQTNKKTLIIQNYHTWNMSSFYKFDLF